MNPDRRPAWERLLAELPELERHAINRGAAPAVSGLHDRFRPYLVRCVLGRLAVIDSRGNPFRAPTTPPTDLQAGPAQRLAQQAIATILEEVHALRAAAEAAEVEARRKRPPSAGWKPDA